MAGESTLNSNGKTTEQDIEQLYLEQLDQFYELALDATEEYLDLALSNPLDEFQDVIKKYDFVNRDNAPEVLSEWNNLRQIVLEKKENFAKKMWERVYDIREEYQQYKKEQRSFKQDYIDMFGSENFHLDPDKPIWEQITREDILNDFMDNQLDKMDPSIARLFRGFASNR